ncbi:MAG: ABC transporter substrate-binding protein, partial [Ktedonobacterales bacterium]|nr:ABC transporter substrate-binding protein [Ktedonobacterales bacterium]
MAKRFRFWSIVVGALFFVPVLLAACGPSTTGGSNNGPKQGGTITDGLYEEPDSLLPFLTNETYAVMVDQALWAPLWYGDPSGQLHAGIAKEVPSASNGDVSADLKTWTIKVQSGLKWSDGSPLTADDVAFSLKTYTDPAFGNTFGLPTTDPKDPIGVASVTEPDSSTVVLTLRNPDVAILSLLADGASSVIPKSVFGSLGAANVAKSPQAFKPTVTSGPFMMSERVQGDHITLVRNPNYYQAGKPYLDKLIFKIIANQDTILTALQSGTIDTSWFLDVTKFNAYKAISGYTTTTDANPAGYEVLVFNECTKVGVAGCVRTSLLQD